MKSLTGTCSFICILLSLTFSSSCQIKKTLPAEKKKPNPFFASKSPQKLAEYLTFNDSTDIQKVHSIYTWIIHNIKYDLKALNKVKTKVYTPKQTLLRRKGICYQYSDLFNTLCQTVGISSKTILGYSRGLQYFEGDTFYEADHSWNGVKIDSAWFLVDATWGSGGVVQRRQWLKKLMFKWFDKPYINNKYKFIPEPSYKYFLAPPEAMIKDHLPVDPTWQLVKFPIPIQYFEHKDWNGYVDVIDTMNQKMVDSVTYSKNLNKYEFLPNNAYLYETAKKSNFHNPKNFKLLSEALFRNATSHRNLDADPAVVIEQNTSIKKELESCISNGKRHLKTINSEIQSMLKNARRRINLELTKPSKRGIKLNKQMLSRNSKIISKAEKVLLSDSIRVNKLTHSIINWKHKNLSSIKHAKNQKKELIKQNQVKLYDSFRMLKTRTDSLLILMNELDYLQSQKAPIRSELLREALQFNLNIQVNSTDIMNNSNFSVLSNSMSLVDTSRQKMHRLNLELSNLENSIKHLRLSIRKIQSSIQYNGRLNQKMLYENCNFSYGKECDNFSYFVADDYVHSVEKSKLKIAQRQLKQRKSDFEYSIIIIRRLVDQRDFLEVNASLISHYQMNREAGLMFKKSKSTYEVEVIVRQSYKMIKSLSAMNKKLKKREKSRT